MASPTPVFPEVGSTIVPPGRSLPSRSAASIIAIPIRSLFEPPGLRYSSFASSVGRTSRAIRSSRTIGVPPTRSSSVGYSLAMAEQAYAIRTRPQPDRGDRRRLPVGRGGSSAHDLSSDTETVQPEGVGGRDELCPGADCAFWEEGGALLDMGC